MNPWLESVGVTLLAVSGVLLGWLFSKLRKPYWLIGYIIPLALVSIYAIATLVPSIAYAPPISWMMMGRNKFSMFGFVCAILLTTPLSRLKQRRHRIAICILMVVVVAFVSVAPFVAPALNRNYLAHLQTNLDANGVCRQSDDFTCGPAATVTALRKLGIPAEIGEIAILERANSLTGTDLEDIPAVLQKRFGGDGIVADFRLFKDLAELNADGITITVVQFDAFTDHAVTVLDINDKEVVVGDPLSGMAGIPHDEFLTKWYRCGVVLKRKQK